MDCYIHEEATSPGMEGELDTAWVRFPLLAKGLTVFSLGCLQGWPFDPLPTGHISDVKIIN